MIVIICPAREVKGVQEHAFGLLKNLCQSEACGNARRLADVGGVEALLQKMISVFQYDPSPKHRTKQTRF